MNIEKGNYRLKNINRFVDYLSTEHQIVSKTLDEKEGLAIEKNCGDNSYIVIAFVEPDNDGYPVLKSVGMRLIEEVDGEDFEIVKDLADIAGKIVRLNNNER